MDPKAFKALLAPGGIVLLAAILLLEGGLIPIASSAVDFYYYAVFISGILLAWRFHSSRVFFCLLSLLLSHRALEFFSAGHAATFGSGRIAFETVAFLLPLNFIAFSFVRERGFAVPVIATRVALVFFESVFVAILCRPGEKTAPLFFHDPFLGRSLVHWTKIPPAALLAFAAAFVIFACRFFLYRKPAESGLLWSAIAACLSLQKGGVSPISSAYAATAGLILLSSIIENTYFLAYHDELTSLPSRRAFNEALLRLEEPYSIAVADIDHFKRFNDSYGHDTGDQVLRLVAAKLARVTGGGKAFRVGGEEFDILFPGTRMKDAVPHLEQLRVQIANTSFHMREAPERRSAPRGSDRRTKTNKPQKKSAKISDPLPAWRDGLSVTISIGVAEPASQTQSVEQVIEAADKALYRAKQAGRNRVETTAARLPKPRRRLA